MTITAAHIDAATHAWQRARLYDDRVGEIDRLRLTAWADAIASINATETEAIDAVSAWYLAGGRDRPIQVGDMLAEIRRVRRDELDRQAANVTGPTVPVDPQLGLPIAGADGEPVWDAYDGIDTIVCPTCNAQPAEACVNLATNMTRKIPCIARTREATRNRTKTHAHREARGLDPTPTHTARP